MFVFLLFLNGDEIKNIQGNIQLIPLYLRNKMIKTNSCYIDCYTGYVLD